MVFDLSTVGTVTAAMLTAAVVAVITTPVVRALAFRIGAVDVPKDGRRMHDHPIPRMGGLAIFFGFLLSFIIFFVAYDSRCPHCSCHSGCTSHSACCR